MHPSEIEDVLKTFTLITDTREQPTKRSEVRYKQFGCPYKREKLDFGDYSAVLFIDGKECKIPVVVERKMSLTELAMCYTSERGRFEREFERAKEAGSKVYLLLENSTWKSAYSGNYRSKMLPQSLVASMLAWLARYNCQLIMCDSTVTGKLIHDILYREAKEYLTRMVTE